MKRDDGYALPFVLVVSVVMCLIAVTVMSFSLKNLQVQQDSIQRTQAKYDAAGKVEKIIAATKNDVEDTLDFSSEDLVFEVPNGENVVKISARGLSPNGTIVWLVTEIELLNVAEGKTITATDFGSISGGVLTVKYNGGISFKSYSYEQVSEEGG